ncbi:MAG: BamA/TamA family outer membrane protein [Bacteroidota bacterium]|nr:BamA/TamA family outer membrane protein [Bacteroidota bacterium]
MLRKRIGVAVLTFLLAAGSTTITHAQDARVPAEYETVVSAVQKVMGLLQDVTQRHATDPINDQILAINDRLTLSGPVTGGFRESPDEDLVSMLRDIEQDLARITQSLERHGDDELARELDAVIRDLGRAIEKADESNYDARIRRDAPNRYEIRSRKDRVVIRTQDDDWWDDDEWKRRDRERTWRFDRDDLRDEWRDTFREGNFDSLSDTDVFGEWNHRWPYQTQATYRNIPAIRYNRVDGLFLGVTRSPLEWSSWDRGRIYGQGGYAFASDEWLYRVGVETRLGSRRSNPNFDVKIGGSHQRNTDTDDLWKASWGENSAAAFFFRQDFFHYHRVEGWSAYVVARMTRYAQFSAAYRDDSYRSLSAETNWSIFGDGNFRPNRAINDGQMHSFVLALEGGSIRDLANHPSGVAFRLEAEIGQGVGGDFDFSRYLGDIRSYTRLTRQAGLHLRLRGGFTEGTVPVQKAFTLGGIGTVRGYEQNGFIGTRMALANAELTLYDTDIADWILNNIVIFGTFDAGWTNTQAGTNAFSTDDLITSAGFGLSFDDRLVRLEVSWPLRDLGTGYEPSLWLRFNPTF